MIALLIVLLVLQAAWTTDAISNVRIGRKHFSMHGKASVTFYGPSEKLWAGISDARRFPVIHSGNIIALRSNAGYRYRWIQCGATSSYCYYSNCPGGKVMKRNKWSKCRREQFYIRAVNKNDGQPIISGDFVTLAPYNRGSTCRLRCFKSTSTKCNSRTCVSESAFKGNNIFQYSYLTFQIFSRNSKDFVDAVQYGDIVGFRYPFYYANHWLYFNGAYLYANTCSYQSKYSCAASNNFGFRIYKQL